MNDKMPKNDKEALLLGLRLAVSCPERHTNRLNEVLELCSIIASRLTEKEVEECKQIVEFELNALRDREDNAIVH